MLVDMSFKNEMIQGYFNGDNSYVPTSELIYLHEHPLIKTSFLKEIELMINIATQTLIEKNIKGVIVQRFVDASIALGAELPTVNQQNAPKILEHLRTIYNLCKMVK